MAARQIQALSLLARITRQELETEAAALGRVRAEIDALIARQDALVADLAAQAGSRSLETLPHMPAYLRAVRAEQGRLSGELAALQAREAELEEAVRRRFAEKKSTETALDAARQADRARHDRAEAAVLDEHALLRHGRAAAGRLRG